MQTTYHLNSAQDVNQSILEAIKLAFQSRPISITINEEENFELSVEMKHILDERLIESQNEYITSKQSIASLKSKYGL